MTGIYLRDKALPHFSYVHSQIDDSDPNLRKAESASLHAASSGPLWDDLPAFTNLANKGRVGQEIVKWFGTPISSQTGTAYLRP